MQIIPNHAQTTNTLSGVWMLFALLMALIFSNTTEWYADWLHMPFLWHTAFFDLKLSLASFVKDCLMVFFFAQIGMELRLQYEEGFLADRRQILLPLMAALGGMVVPAMIYALINLHHPENTVGFAIPCATDIAFALCVWNIIRHSLPPSLRVFLLSIAIFDDLGAMLMIAIFYNNHFNGLWLLLGLLIVGIITFLSARKVTYTWFYVLMGAFLCVCFHKAGLHTTLAGFMVGALLPLRGSFGESYLKTLMHQLEPWVQWLVLPLFAFVSSGVSLGALQLSDWHHPIFLGVFLGLFLGKQLGITGVSYAMLRLKWAVLPPKSSMTQVYTVSIFAGIGFTMSLFIGLLAFENHYQQNLVKMGVIAGSLACVLLLTRLLKPEKTLTRRLGATLSRLAGEGKNFIRRS
ncbi:MAG: Na+/H+ antiporter NhaA [Gammaproteobacteria bacterium]|nr:Na+/H+ antiporter NhaA [Gammaproteobacteria bacterium]MBP9728795.1 Na+/H+ antiporter NhaA [Gammaproteobacteria bacterium]